MSKMRLWQNLILWTMLGLSFFAMIGIPLLIMYNRMFVGQETIVKKSFIWAFVVGVIGVISFFVLRAWYKRKLQSIDIADELGVNGTTPIIAKRVLLLLQFAVPLGAFSLFLYGLDKMQSLELPNYKMFFEFEYWIIGGVFGLLVHDYLRAFWRRQNAIKDHINFEEKVEKKKRKIKNKRKVSGVFR